MKPLAIALLTSLLLSSLSSAIILVRIPGVTGDAKVEGYDNGEWFVADSFSFGVERELVDGGKGGTADINIGVGEPQVFTVSKSQDKASARLMLLAVNGNASQDAEIRFVQLAGGADPKPVVYLVYKLDRCFIKSWSTSGDADDRPTEEVAFYYNKIAFRYYHTEDGKTFTDGGVAGWDLVKSIPWTTHGLPPTPPLPGK